MQLQKHSRKFGRTRNSVETLALLARVPTSISRSPKPPGTRVSITVWKYGKCMFSIFKEEHPSPYHALPTQTIH